MKTKNMNSLKILITIACRPIFLLKNRAREIIRLRLKIHIHKYINKDLKCKNMR